MGDGAPVLRGLAVDVRLSQFVPCESAVCPFSGAGWQLDWNHTLSPAPDQVGVGSLDSQISWGSLTGWTHTGQLACEKLGECPGGCACTLVVGFEGTGPAPPVDQAAFDSDPWIFSQGAFAATPIEIVNLAAGQVTETIVWRGALLGTVPLLPPLPLAALTTALLALGVWAGRR